MITLLGLIILGYHLTGSAGRLFPAGIVVGTAWLLGLALLLAGPPRASRRRSAAPRRLRESRLETAAVSRERDDLIDQHATARADAVSQQSVRPDRPARNRPRPHCQPAAQRHRPAGCPAQAGRRSQQPTPRRQALARSPAIRCARRPASFRDARQCVRSRRG